MQGYSDLAQFNISAPGKGDLVHNVEMRCSLSISDRISRGKLWPKDKYRRHQRQKPRKLAPSYSSSPTIASEEHEVSNVSSPGQILDKQKLRQRNTQDRRDSRPAQRQCVASCTCSCLTIPVMTESEANDIWKPLGSQKLESTSANPPVGQIALYGSCPRCRHVHTTKLNSYRALNSGENFICGHCSRIRGVRRYLV